MTELKQRRSVENGNCQGIGGKKSNVDGIAGELRRFYLGDIQACEAQAGGCEDDREHHLIKQTCEHKDEDEKDAVIINSQSGVFCIIRQAKSAEVT